MGNEVSMEIVRADGVLSSVKVFMPIWSRKETCGNIFVIMPVFGIETFLADGGDIDKAIKEAVQCFCIAAEECGYGLETELENLGWERRNDGQHSFMEVPTKTRVFNSIIHTGERTALELEMA